MKKMRIGIATLLSLAASARAQTVNEDIKITAFDAMAQANFGRSVASHQGVLAVGAYGDDHGGGVLGSVYLYDSNPDSPTYGSFLGKIKASEEEEGLFFGCSVAIDDGVLAVGAIKQDSYEGVVYLFDSDPGSPSFGTQIGKLAATDQSIDDLLFAHAFGDSIVIEDGAVFIGAPNDDQVETNAGAVYVFDGDPASPSFQAQLGKITASDGMLTDHFGSSVSIDQGVLVVSAFGDDEGGRNYGSVYIYDGDLTSATFGSEMYKLTASDAEDGDTFKGAMAIDQGVLAIGAQTDASPPWVRGLVCLFDVDPASSTFGTLLIKVPVNDQHWSSFGDSLSLDQGFLAVGYPAYSTFLSQVGAMYVFDADPASPTFGSEVFKLLASDPGIYDLLGSSININHGVIAIGAKSDDVNGMEDAGSVYIVDIGCPQDVNRDFVLDFYDLDAFMTLYAQNDLAVDFDDNGELDFFDVSEFLEEFAAGCPIAH